jgi:hypothetical protein
LLLGSGRRFPEKEEAPSGSETDVDWEREISKMGKALARVNYHNSPMGAGPWYTYDGARANRAGKPPGITGLKTRKGASYNFGKRPIY